MELPPFLQVLKHMIDEGGQTLAVIGLPAAIGAFFLVSLYAGMIRFLSSHFLRRGPSAETLGPWVAVTGATDGIGKAFCQQLAKKGLNVVLISRTESKLQAVAAELESQYKIQTKYVAADLTNTSEAKWKEIEEVLDSVELGLLINNAGQSYDHAEYLELVSEKDIRDMVEMNVVALTKMCQLVLPGMKERGKGHIVNMGSSSGCIPSCPFLAAYAGTKAYVDVMSRALDAECRLYNVRVQCQAPFLIATKLAKIKRTSIDVPSPDTYVKAALHEIGHGTMSIPYWVHHIMYNALWFMPSILSRAVVYNMHMGLRKRWYKKQEREAKQQ